MASTRPRRPLRPLSVLVLVDDDGLAREREEERKGRGEKAILFAGDRVLSEKEGGSEWANEGGSGGYLGREEEGAQHLSQGRVVFNATGGSPLELARGIVDLI